MVRVSILSISNTIRNISEVTQSNRYTCGVHCPDNVVCNSNGCIFIGGYLNNKWHSDSIKNYWEDIRNIRGNYGNHVIRTNKTMRNKIKRESCKLAKIISQVEQLTVNRKVVQLSVSVVDVSVERQ